MPDANCRKKIWEVHIRPTPENPDIRVPLADDVDTQALAEKYDGFCGRDIRNAVINTCIHVARENRDIVAQADFVLACDKMVVEAENLERAKAANDPKPKPKPATPEQEKAIAESVIASLPDAE